MSPQKTIGNSRTERPKHVFVGLTEIAGFYRNLALGLDSSGVRATHVDLSGNPYGYRSPSDVAPPRWIQALVTLLTFLRGGAGLGITARKLVWAAAREAVKIPIGLWAVSSCDTFIFGFRTHFVSHWELPVLRFLGKRTVFIFNGSDARPPYLDGYFVPPTGPIRGKALAARTRRTKRRLSRIERYADAVIAHPPAAQLLDKPYVPWLEIGVPYPTSELVPQAEADSQNRRLSVVHAPTHRVAKGSDAIAQAIAEVSDAGIDIDIIELFGRSNDEVLEALRNADFVIDQIYSDTPMAGLATEAASVGKPTIVGGYELDIVAAHTAPEMLPPSLTCLPDDIADGIARLARDEDLRNEIGNRAYAFLKDSWNPESVARRVLEVVSGERKARRPSSEELRHYTHGVGLTEARRRDAINSVIAARGTGALHVGDPVVLDALLQSVGLGIDS